ncbi:MAG: response regulator [Saprospiraceae bacterium]
MIKILIVEDELIIAEDMSNILEQMGYQVHGIAMDADEAIACLENEKPDLILLDINLGGKKDGIDLAAIINEKFDVPFIFTTSYTDPATIDRAKVVKPINYLVKPFKPEQLYTAIEIAMFNLAKNPEKQTTPDTEHEDGLIIKDALFIKDKYRYTKLSLSDILWIKAEGNYLEIHLAERKELIRNSLTSFLDRLNKSNFYRTHKSYAVNLDYLSRVEPTAVYILRTEIPISKNYSEDLMKRLNVM